MSAVPYCLLSSSLHCSSLTDDGLLSNGHHLNISMPPGPAVKSQSRLGRGPAFLKIFQVTLNSRRLVQWSIIKMTIGVFGVYVVAVVRTHTLKVVLSRMCIFATQDRRPLVLWLGNGVCASAFWGLWSHFAGSWACEERSLALFYGKTYSEIVSSLTTRTGSIPKIDGGCLLYGYWRNTKQKYSNHQNGRPC